MRKEQSRTKYGPRHGWHYSPAPLAKKSPHAGAAMTPPKSFCIPGWRRPPSTKPRWYQHVLKKVGWRQRSRQGYACLGSHKVTMQKPWASQMLSGGLPVASLRSTHASFPAPRRPAWCCGWLGGFAGAIARQNLAVGGKAVTGSSDPRQGRRT